MSEEIKRFTITIAHNGYYKVSQPNYSGGEVVDAASYDALIAEVRRLREESVKLNSRMTDQIVNEVAMLRQRQEGERVRSESDLKNMQARWALERQVKELQSANAELRAATFEEVIAIIENTDRIYYDDPDRPTQISHGDLEATLDRIVSLIRKALAADAEVKP